MADENQSSESTTEVTETGTSEQQEQDQQTTGETFDQVEQESSQNQSQDKTDPGKASLLADLHKERSERKTAQGRITELEQQVSELQPTKDTLDAVQTRYDRLESFLSAVGGPLSRALDSRSFTHDLFESDKDIDQLVQDWHRNNPSATSAALGSGPSETSGGKPGINDLLRAAAPK